MRPPIGTEGALSLPMALLLLAVATGTFGTLELMHRWRKIAQLQLSLDECVRARVGELVENLESVERNNSRMRGLRATIAATVAFPQAHAAARRLLAMVDALQVAQRGRWEADGIKWMLKRCSVSAWVFGYPAFPWRAGTPDILGARPWAWAGSDMGCIRVAAFRKPRKAVGELFRGKEGWVGRWRRPSVLLNGGCGGEN